MKNLIRKILNEAVKKEDLVVINGVEFVVGDYISHNNNKSDIFLILAKNAGKSSDRHATRISYEKFLEIKNTLINAGLKSSPQSYNSDGNKTTHVYEIRVTVDVPNIVRTYLDVVLNTNTDSLFEQEEGNLDWTKEITSLKPLEFKERKIYYVDYGDLENFIESVYGKSVEIPAMLESNNDTTHEFSTNRSWYNANEIKNEILNWVGKQPNTPPPTVDDGNWGDDINLDDILDFDVDDDWGDTPNLSTILFDLAENKKLIPSGDWMVRVSW